MKSLTFKKALFDATRSSMVVAIIAAVILLIEYIVYSSI